MVICVLSLGGLVVGRCRQDERLNGQGIALMSKRHEKCINCCEQLDTCVAIGSGYRLLLTNM